jgi:cytochrome c oxidase subunit II
VGTLGKLPILQAQASSIAPEYDALFWVVTLNAIFFTVLIFLGILYLTVRYRRGAVVDRSRAPQHNLAIELTWTLIPLGIALGIFAWATSLYFHQVSVPRGAMEIHVVGKQWMWKLQHPTGRWENNTLHVPLGRPIMLNMISEDVIHSFYIPAFRVKQDVFPGQFTRLWFTPTRVGEYHLFCAEFCGTLHATMIGTVYVMEPADYARWLAEGDVETSAAAQGAQLFRAHGCSGCHAANSSVRAPRLEGKWGQMVPVQARTPGVALEQTQATLRLFDTRYVHDSIILPEQEIAAGYRPIMPSFRNRITEEEILKIVAYIRSLGAERDLGPDGPDGGAGLTAEDYRARTGFVPENIPSGAAGGAGGGAPAPTTGQPAQPPGPAATPAPAASGTPGGLGAQGGGGAAPAGGAGGTQVTPGAGGTGTPGGAPNQGGAPNGGAAGTH